LVKIIAMMLTRTLALAVRASTTGSQTVSEHA
jgi:hypothetical protein